jgi:DNA-binding transcriptional LysR family regulator
MDTQLLKAFIEVAGRRSFSAAAEHLHLTQPAISKRIALLEQQLDCRLFDRIGRKIFMTEAGLALLPRARQILMAVDDTQRAMGNLSGHVAGELHVATSHHIGLHRLPPLLRRYTREFPRVRLALEFMDSEVAFEAVLRGEVELAVITLGPQSREEQGIDTVPLWDDPLSFVVSRDHPLAQAGPLDLQQLTTVPAILPSPNTYTTQLVTALFNRHHLPLQPSMATNYLETIKMLVTTGLGWSVLPDSIIDAELAVLSHPELRLTRQLGCICHRERTLSNAARQFLELIRS